jgi:hypothetical protein
MLQNRNAHILDTESRVLEAWVWVDGLWLVDTKTLRNTTPHQIIDKDKRFRNHTTRRIPRGLCYWPDDLHVFLLLHLYRLLARLYVQMILGIHKPTLHSCNNSESWCILLERKYLII